ncbi:MAG: hypothetical protein V1798_02210 [Pseudomonadota bacterium]
MRKLWIVLFALGAACSDTITPGSGLTPAKPSSDPTTAQVCVDLINQYRSSIGLAAYSRWTDAESCSDAEALSDSKSGQAHGAFQSCGEMAQNECPGWAGPAGDMIGPCLASMWAEGPGSDFSAHGHYLNMSSTSYTMAACGFSVTAGGAVWSVQNFK